MVHCEALTVLLAQPAGQMVHASLWAGDCGHPAQGTRSILNHGQKSKAVRKQTCFCTMTRA
jgi:hypothetical protein